MATYGSCFAQHIGKALVNHHYTWLDTEPRPVGFQAIPARKFGYGIFSSRTGNIYTATLLKQWIAWAAGAETPPDEVWEQDGRFHDPFRPVIEPGGFASVDELVGSRQATIQAVYNAVANADIFVFTLGLTESWLNSDGQYEYPLCPGTAAGTFSQTDHKFENQDYQTILNAMQQAIELMRRINPDLRILLTVSPVPFHPKP